MRRFVLRAMFLLLVAVWIFAAFSHSGKPRNPLSRTEVSAEAVRAEQEEVLSQLIDSDIVAAEPGLDADELRLLSMDLVESIKDYVDTPKGGVDWKLFGDTEQITYLYSDKEGREWEGFRPKFSDELTRLNGREVLVKGFMFPLGQQEGQVHFLLGPFPVSCPFHYDVTPNLMIEVHSTKRISFSYDAVSIRGKLELVPQDDEYNVFYRLKEARRVL